MPVKQENQQQKLYKIHNLGFITPILYETWIKMESWIKTEMWNGQSKELSDSNYPRFFCSTIPTHCFDQIIAIRFGSVILFTYPIHMWFGMCMWCKTCPIETLNTCELWLNKANKALGLSWALWFYRWLFFLSIAATLLLFVSTLILTLSSDSKIWSLKFLSHFFHNGYSFHRRWRLIMCGVTWMKKHAHNIGFIHIWNPKKKLS